MPSRQSAEGNSRVTLYDTTLRDGTQREGLSLSAEDKLRIVRRLDGLGIHVIEGGFPASNPKDIEFFGRVRDLELKNAVIASFGQTRRKDIPAAEDEGLRALLDSGTPAITLVGKAWDIHVTETLRTSLEENLAMVSDSVAYLKAAGRVVYFDAEHFFDGYAANAGYALAVCRAAADAGADGVVLCDTNGGTLPQDIERVVAVVVEQVRCEIGIHAHDDAGCAVANSLIAVGAGARQVQGTINGYGERAGNADLIAVLPALKLKLGIPVVTDDQLKLLTEVSHFVAETANLAPDPHQPYVGASAFAHKGGMHASAVDRLDAAYEHVDPASIGNKTRVLVSELAGRASLTMKAAEMGIDLSDQPERVGQLLDEIKRLEHAGYAFETADGSLELMLRRRLGMYEPFFRLESFDVMLNKREDGRVATDAIVRIWVEGERLVAWAEAGGPVNALDWALRRALNGRFPGLDRIELIDYKVRVLEDRLGTGKVTRVLVESTNGEQTWGTIGVSENIIEASWEALVDAVEFGLTHPPEDAR